MDEPSRTSSIGCAGHENACDDCFPLVPASGPIPRRGCCCTGSLESWDSGDDSRVLWSLTHDQPMGLCLGLQSGWAVWAVLPMTSGADCGSNGRWSLFTESKPTDHLEPSRCFHGTRRSGGRSHWRYSAIMPQSGAMLIARVCPASGRTLSLLLQIYPITGQWGFTALNGKRPDQRATSLALAMSTLTMFDGTMMVMLVKVVCSMVGFVSCLVGRVRSPWPDERTSQEIASCPWSSSINHAEDSVVAL